MNRRRYQRTPTQYFTKFAFINDKLAVESPPGFNRAVIENISFGGLSLIIIPEVQPEVRKKLVDGKLNVYMDFNLPPSLRQIEITGKVKWVKDKAIKDPKMTLLGVEFINKNKVLFKEIDDFIKTDGKGPLLKDKRRFSRVPVDIKVRFSIRKFRRLNLFSAVHEGFVKDISAGGMAVIVAPALGKGHSDNLMNRKKYLFLKFYIPETNRFLSLTGLPTRIRNVTVEGKTVTFMGVRFLNVSERDRHELIEFVCHRKASFVRENTAEKKTPASGKAQS